MESADPACSSSGSVCSGVPTGEVVVSIRLVDARITAFGKVSSSSFLLLRQSRLACPIGSPPTIRCNSILDHLDHHRQYASSSTYDHQSSLLLLFLFRRKNDWRVPLCLLCFGIKVVDTPVIASLFDLLVRLRFIIGGLFLLCCALRFI